MKMSLKLFGLLAVVFATTACAGLKEIAQGTVDQFAAADAAPQSPATVARLQIPEDALLARDKQLSEAMYQLGRKVARGYEPKTRLYITVASRADAEWLIADIDRGIASTKWQREAVMLPPVVSLSNGYPTIRVVEGIRE